MYLVLRWSTVRKLKLLSICDCLDDCCRPHVGPRLQARVHFPEQYAKGVGIRSFGDMALNDSFRGHMGQLAVHLGLNILPLGQPAEAKVCDLHM